MSSEKPVIAAFESEPSNQKLAEIRSRITTGEPISFQKWLEAREDYRRFLFGDKTDHTKVAITRSSSQINSLVALSQAVFVSGSTSYEKFSKQELKEGVEAILRTHEEQKHTEERGIFGFVDPERDLQRVADVTAKVIWTWERAWMRRNKHNSFQDADNPSPFSQLPIECIEVADFERPDVQLVVETAAAVVEVLQAGYTSGKVDSYISRYLSGFIADRGPDFAGAWIRGTHIRNYCEQQGLDTEQWLRLIPRSERANFAIRNHMNPLEPVKRVIATFNTLDVEHIREERGISEEGIANTLIRKVGAPETALESKAQREAQLIYQAIADKLGWGIAEVKEFFTLGDLKRIAKANADPLERIGQIVKKYETLLTTENLIKESNLSPHQVEILFPAWRRRSLIIKNTDPLNAARNRANDFSELAREYPELSEKMIANLVDEQSLPIARSIAKKVLQEQINKPKGVSETIWMWATLRFPYSNKEERQRHVNAYLLYLSLRHPRSSEPTSTNDTRTVYDRMGDTSSLGADPADIILPSDAEEKLHKIARRAGINSADLNQLLDNFSSDYSSDMDKRESSLYFILQKLRKAANENDM